MRGEIAMRSTSAVGIFFLIFAASVFAERVRVTGDRVNIRAASNLTSRVMGQVSDGTVLQAVTIGETWVEILPPPDVFGWIHGDLVKEGRISSSRANIRSGPGVNYEIIARVEKNDPVKEQGRFNEWIKITPPEGTTVWISREYTGPLEQITDTPPPPAPSVLTNKPANIGVAPKPPKPLSDEGRISSPAIAIPEHDLSSAGITSNMLIQGEQQDVIVKKKGILKRASLVWRRPSRYVLIDPDSNAEDKALCYVTGSDPQLEAVTDRKMTIEGAEYRVQGAKYPVLKAAKIVLH